MGHRLGESGRPVPFISAYRLVQDMLAARRDLDLPQGIEESEVPFTPIAERYERRPIGTTSNLVSSEWKEVFANPMATAATIDRIVHHSAILEFDMPSYRTGEAQERQLHWTPSGQSIWHKADRTINVDH